MTTARTDLRLDSLTLMAMGVVSFVIANVLHEALGHGGACLLVGGAPLELSSAHFQCSIDGDGWARRFIASAGTITNFIAAFAFWFAYRHIARGERARYFCWFAMCNNYFVAAGYPLFSGIIGVGDWVTVVSDWQPAWLLRLALAGVGAVLYFAIGIPWALRSMASLIGADDARLARASRLTVVPYLAGATATSLGALLNPIGPFVMFTSAAAAFGGNSALAWMTQLLKGERYQATRKEHITIERSAIWIVFAVLMAIAHIAVLGPSIRLS